MNREFGVVGAVERAMAREARVQGAALRNGLGSLKIISGLAVILAHVGMLDQLAYHSFYSLETSRPYAHEAVGNGVLGSLLLMMLALAVSISAFVFHTFLSSWVDELESGME